MTAYKNYQPTATLEMVEKRAEMLAKIRQFFAKRQVLEVQTPIISQAGNTDVFIKSVTTNTHFYGKAIKGYLHTSPEFAMKRLLATWQKPIYQICPVFRDDEMGNRHNIEFTMLEWYRPNFTLNQLASELSELLGEIYGSYQIIKQYRYSDAFLEYVGIHPLVASCTVLSAIAEDRGIMVDMGDDHQGWLDVLFSHLVEPKLGHDMPTLITDYPAVTASLAKISTDKDGYQVAKRFELYINGVEIANAYDELADGKELLERFQQDNQQRKKLGLPQIPIDKQLIKACDDMPECSGIAVGIDRLLMVLTGANAIEEVINFPFTQA
ncbi:MAG: EF-P lysine aminoacylase GenX [Moraxellaceae bacterium]|nr:EF-P lysine aminoacylase GenX [Moraxellaceae bacterium]